MKGVRITMRKYLRRLSLVVLVLFGCIAIIASGEEDTKPVPEKRETGVYNYIITDYTDGEGRITRTWSRKYDEAEVLQMEKSEYYNTDENLVKEEGDDDGDGTLDWVYTYTYEGLNLTFAVYEDIADASTNAARYFYDDHGNITERQADLSYDGAEFSADQVYAYTYEDIDGEWEMVLERLDEDDDGDWDYTNIFSYDENGNLEKVEYYFGDEAEAYTTSSYTYVLIADEWYMEVTLTDLDNNGETDFSYGYDYDDDGNMTSMESFLGEPEDGTLVTGNYYSYDDEDLLIKEEIDDSGNGKIDNAIYYEYYADGNLWKKKYDYDNNDPEECDLIYIWTYETIVEGE
ncbi:MAG: hypothetical protein JXO48_11360 [Deltaproteobacteria bacterium]|nr:hypothetical protein [Deltaproteobacteria bacterium]